MGTGIKMGGGGAMKVINGIVKDYYAIAEDISANSFAEYVEDYFYYYKSNLTSFPCFGQSIQSTILGSDTVLFTYSDTNGYYYARAIAIKLNIDSKTFTAGTSVQINTNKYSGFGSAVKIDDHTAIYCFSSSDGVGYATITIEDDLTINVSSQILYSGHTLSSYGKTSPKCAVLTDDQDILFATTNYPSNGVSLFSVNYTNGTISLVNNYDWGDTAIPLGLSNMGNGVFVISLLYHTSILVSGFAFKYGDRVILETGELTTFIGCSSFQNNEARAIKYDNNTIVYAYAYGSTFYPYIMLVKLDGLTLTMISNTNIGDIKSISWNIYTNGYEISKVGNSVVIGFAGGTSGGYGNLIQIKISDDYSLSAGNIFMSQTNWGVTKLTIAEFNKGVFITYDSSNGNSNLYGRVYVTGVFPINSGKGDTCLTIKDCKLDLKGKVYVPIE